MAQWRGADCSARYASRVRPVDPILTAGLSLGTSGSARTAASLELKTRVAMRGVDFVLSSIARATESMLVFLPVPWTADARKKDRVRKKAGRDTIGWRTLVRGNRGSRSWPFGALRALR